MGDDSHCNSDEFCLNFGVNPDKTLRYTCAKKLAESQPGCVRNNWCIDGFCTDEGKCDDSANYYDGDGEY